MSFMKVKMQVVSPSQKFSAVHMQEQDLTITLSIVTSSVTRGLLVSAGRATQQLWLGVK